MNPIKTKRLSPVSVVIYILFALTIAGFLFFQQIHIPEREQILRDKGVRTLVNIEKRLNEYENYLEKVLIQRLVAQKLLESNYDLKLYEKKALKNHLNPLKQTELEGIEKPYLTKLDTSVETGLMMLYCYKDSNVVQQIIEGLEKNDSTKLDTVNLVDILINLKLEAKGGDDISVIFSKFSVNALFDCVILHDASKGNILASNNDKLINVTHSLLSSKKDSIVSDGFGVDIFPTKVNSARYIQFRHTIKLGNQNLFLSGFINANDFELYSKEVDYWILIVVIISILLIISAIPFIKVFVINKWERLRGRDVVSSGLGLILVIFFTSLLFTTTGHYKELKSKLDYDLNRYGETLANRFVTELSSALKALDSFGQFEDLAYLKGINYHEAFRSNSVGRIDKLILPYGYSDSTKTPYVDILFSEFLDLKDRNYIKAHGGSGLYKLRSDISEVKPDSFYFEPVFSYLRAEQEAVVSKRSKADTNGKEDIDVLAFDIKSFLWDVTPYEHGFALVDADLNVLFTSEQSVNNFKNLRSDVTGGDFIRNAVLLGGSARGEFQYGRDQYRACIQPLNRITKGTSEKAAFYILTFANEDILEWQTGISAMLTFTICLFILIGLLTFLILSILFGVRRSDKRLFESKRVYDLFYPRNNEAGCYIFLCILALVSIGIQIIVLNDAGLALLACFGVSQIFIFGFFRVILHSNPEQNDQIKTRNIFLIICLLGAYLPYILLVTTFENFAGKSAIVGVFGHILLLLITVFVVPKLKRQAQLTATENSVVSEGNNMAKRRISRFRARKVYPVSIILWLMATLLIPLLIISNRCEEAVENSFEHGAVKIEED